MLAYPSREEWKCFSLKGVSSVFVYIGWFLTSCWTTYIRNANISETCSVEKIRMFCGENSHLYFTFRKEFTHVHIGRGSGLMLLIFHFHFLYKMLQELLFFMQSDWGSPPCFLCLLSFSLNTLRHQNSFHFKISLHLSNARSIILCPVLPLDKTKPNLSSY